MLSGSKLLCGLLSNHLCPSGSVNMLGGSKQVILDASGEGWVEQTTLGGFPLLHIIQVLTAIILLRSISMFVFMKVCSLTTTLTLIVYFL